MTYERTELTGALFQNNKKEKETHPDFTGSCLIEGIHYWVSAWTKTDRNNEEWYSLSFTLKDKQPIKPLIKE